MLHLFGKSFLHTTLILLTAFSLVACGDKGKSTDSSVAPSPAIVTTAFDIKQITLKWSPVSGATYYKVLKSVSSHSAYEQIGANITSTSYADIVAIHLTDWANVSYIVAACNSVGCTDSSVVKGFTYDQLTGYFKASNSGAGRFGASIALSTDGSTMAVGAREASAIYIFVRNGGKWTQQTSFKTSIYNITDNFGVSLALSSDGNTLAVGAETEDSSATGVGGNPNDNAAMESGAVYVYTRTGTNWSQQGYLKASNTNAGDYFGTSVTLSSDGSMLAVGARYEGSSATGIGGNQSDNSVESAGAVYLFTRTGSTWSQQAYIKASNTKYRDLFGYSVALNADGTSLAVGAWGEDSSAKGVDGDQNNSDAELSGAVYLFTRINNTWSQQAYIKASNTYNNNHFGQSLALSADGSVLAVGAYGERSNATGIDGDQSNNSYPFAGAVYVFTRNNSTWSQQAYVKASNTGFSDYFGYSLALSGDGNKLAVAAPYENSNATGLNGNQSDKSAVASGAVHIFTRTNNTWSQWTYIKATNTNPNDYFGAALAMSPDGNTLAVGANGEDSNALGVGGDQSNNSILESGAVYLY